MKNRLTTLCLCMFTLFASGADPLVSTTDFSRSRQKVEVDHTGREFGAFKGVLPEKWSENFASWTRSVAESRVLREPDGPFLRFRVTRLMRAPQFITAMPSMEKGRHYRITAEVRNLSDGEITMQIRDVSSPYKGYFSLKIAPSRQWRSVTQIFSPSVTPPAPIALLILLNGSGEADFRRVVIEEVAADAVEAAGVVRPGHDVPNFFRNTRFPLGLPGGWCVLREQAEGTVATDPACLGPTGVASVQLESTEDGRLGICTEPFQVADPADANAVSFFCRGSGQWEAGVYTENRRVGALTFTPEEAWSRLTVPFTAPADARAFTVRISGSGVLYLDGFRAAPATASAYVPPALCEVALALPASEIDATGIQFADEPAALRYQVTGDGAGGIMRWQVTDLYGDSCEGEPIELAAERLAGVMEFPLPDGRNLGQFRIEAAVFRDGAPISPWNEVIVTRLERPLYWGQDAPDSPFGVHVSSDAHSLTAVKAAGVNWARLHDAGMELTGWAFLEPKKGEWRFRDREIARYRAHHLQVFGQLGTAPGWASYFSKADTGRTQPNYHDRYFQPLEHAEFANYVSTVVGRYRDVIDEWFVWNEPWNPAWWGVGYDRNSRQDSGYLTSAQPQADFAELTRVACEAAREANPDCVISGFNTTAGIGGEKWTRGVYDAGGYDFCDAVDFHFYTPRVTGYPEDAGEAAYRDATGYIRERQGGELKKPVYMSEGQGASSGTGGRDLDIRYAGLCRHTVLWENAEDYDSIADRNVRYCVSMLRCGVRRIFLYSAHNYRDFSTAPAYLVLFQADGRPHPSLAAYAAMARRLEDTRFVETVRLADGLWAHLFERGGSSPCVAVIAGQGGKAVGTEVDADHSAIRLSDLYGNPVGGPAVYRGTVFYAEADLAADQLRNALKVTGTTVK